MDWLFAPVFFGAHVLLFVVFLKASVSKIRNLEEFSGVVSNFRMLPEFAVRPMAFGLPFLELLAAGVLFAGIWTDFLRLYAAGFIFVLLLVFSFAVFVNLLRGRRTIDCGCFGAVLRQELSWLMLARNGGLAAIAVFCLYAPSVGRTPVFLETFTFILTALALYILHAAYESLKASGLRAGAA